MHKRTIYITGSFLVVLTAAIALTIASNNLLLGEEEPYDGVCVIEDCVVSTRKAGFPFRTVEIQKLQGLNCNSYRSSKYCTAKTNNRLADAGNFLFYAGLIASCVFLSCKLIKQRRTITK